MLTDNQIKDINQTIHFHSVTDINSYIKNCIEFDENLSDIWIKGEITNLKAYHLGQQLYFNLSDGQSQINCVIYSNFLDNIDFKLENGLQVYVRGKMKVFHKRGSLSFQVAYMTKEGQGKLSQEFEKLKAQLLKEGLFEPEQKKNIPPYPTRIGLVTAYDSAAMWDFVRVCKQRAPHIHITVSPATVQGVSAPQSIMSALETFQYQSSPQDIVAVIRGGGSAEDLAAFNDETLVRYIAAYPLPLISGIGHEVDYTLTDFVSDFRSPTPTAVAQKVSEPILNWRLTLHDKLERKRLIIKDTFLWYKENCSGLLDQADQIVTHKFEKIDQKIQHLSSTVEHCNPLHKLRQGYSITRTEKTGEIIKSVNQLTIDDTIETQLSDGKYNATITKIKKK